MKRVGVWKAVPLMDGASGEVEHVSSLQHCVQNQLTELVLVEVLGAEYRQCLLLRSEYSHIRYASSEVIIPFRIPTAD